MSNELLRDVRKNFLRRHDTGRYAFLCHRARAFADADFVQFEMIKFLEASEPECVRGAIQRAAVNHQNAFGVFGFEHEVFHAPADAGQTGHLRRAVTRKLAGDAVGDFTGIRATGAGIDHGGWFWPLRAWIFLVAGHKMTFVIAPSICPGSGNDDLTQVNNPGDFNVRAELKNFDLRQKQTMWTRRR